MSGDRDQWTEEDGRTAWEEAQSSARMLGCVLIMASAIVMGIILALVVPVLWDVVSEWLSN